MKSPAAKRILYVLIFQSIMLLVGLFLNMDTWPWYAVFALAAVPPLVALCVYLAAFKTLTLLWRLLLGGAVFFSFCVATSFLLVVSMTASNLGVR